MTFKKVNLIIEVPEGKYCYDGEKVCENHDLDGYGTGCKFKLGLGEEDRKGRIVKPNKCIALTNI